MIGNDNEFSREAWIEQKLKELPAGLTLLDAGAGDQHHKKFCGHLKYISQDIAQYDGQGNGIGLQTGSYDFGKLDIVSDITKIPRPNESFDVILCTEVFEHLQEPIMALREFSRLLKSGGKLILTAPFCSLTHFAPFHYYTGFSKFWYEIFLPNNGLAITELMVNGSYFHYLAQELIRLPYITKTYTDMDLDNENLEKIKKVLYLLEEISKNDKASWEVLNYGFMMVAEKSNVHFIM